MKQQLRQRSTAAWLAVVAASAVVLHGSHQALSPAAGLPDDAVSHALTLDASALTQDDPVTACMTVTAPVAGPADARLRASVLPGSSTATPQGTVVTVETIEPAPGACATATTSEVVFHGPVEGRPDALTQQHGGRSTALYTAWPDSEGGQQTYRITLSLDDVADAAEVTTPSVRIVWDVVPR